MEYRYQIGIRTASLRVERADDGWFVAIDGGQPRLIRLTQSVDGCLELAVDGRRCRVHVVAAGDRRLVAIGSETCELTRLGSRTTRAKRANSGAAGGGLEAAMPGQVVAVAVNEGDTVARGQTLVVLEAMKMELRITAPRDGKVRRVHVVTGQVVERGHVLAELQ